jgi:hypothetical protein
MRPTAEYLVYLAGVVVFGLSYGAVKPLFASEAWFLVAAVVYLVAVRFVGKLLARRVLRKD